MHFSQSLILLTAMTALGAVAKIDIGGPHGNYQPVRRHFDATKPLNEAASGLKRRHRKRSKCASGGSGGSATKTSESKNYGTANASPEAQAQQGQQESNEPYSASAVQSSASGSAPAAAHSTVAAATKQKSQSSGGSGGSGSSGSSGGKGGSSSNSGSSGGDGGSSGGSGGSSSSDDDSSSGDDDDSSSSSAASSSSSSSGNVVSDALASITSFLGDPNTGIGSWFRTNNGNDDTNGRSWCQLSYEDSWMGFAPSVDTMLSNFGNDLETAATHYCGLEAKAVNPSNGNEALIYIVDGFASEWVKTPASVDLTLAAFKALYGEETDDKDTVISNLQWTLTGNRKEEYSYNYGN